MSTTIFLVDGIFSWHLIIWDQVRMNRSIVHLKNVEHDDEINHPHILLHWIYGIKKEFRPRHLIFIRLYFNRARILAESAKVTINTIFLKPREWDAEIWSNKIRSNNEIFTTEDFFEKLEFEIWLFRLLTSSANFKMMNSSQPSSQMYRIVSRRLLKSGIF